MTVILREDKDRTHVLVSESDVARLRPGMRFLNVVTPRSLEADRALIAQMTAREWDGVCLSGIETPADLEKAGALLRVAEANRGLPPSSLSILAIPDTARAALRLTEFDRALSFLCGFLFDAHALSDASGAAMESDLIADLRLRLPLAARASGVEAYLKVTDTAADTWSSAIRDGYRGLCLTET
ncbi:MAG TPA: hypothetical protein VN112_07175 [Ensifer sp.]|nr:hypothetical protein [Ensifer sp.]